MQMGSGETTFLKSFLKSPSRRSGDLNKKKAELQTNTVRVDGEVELSMD